jgi:L-amino acid N-acyltransferase YncA
MNPATSIAIRPATDSDAEAIRAIYNHYVLNDTCTFDTSEQPLDARLEWLKAHQAEGLPVVVAEEGGEVIAWGSLSRYHQRCAYKSSVEFSVYVDHRKRRRGVGVSLVHELLSIARQSDLHCVIGLICSENKASLQMVESLGFDICGELKEVGRKFDRWLDVTFVQLIL